MEEINPDMPQCDVALVIGANDVVNPAARYAKGSPIYGMPIIDADKAKTVLAIKRSKNPGFAGIDNELYVQDNTWMLFGDAKAVIGDLVKQLAGAADCTRPLDAHRGAVHVRASLHPRPGPMRRTPLTVLAAVVTFSTCTPDDSGRVAAPRLAAAHDPDLTGAPT